MGKEELPLASTENSFSSNECSISPIHDPEYWVQVTAEQLDAENAGTRFLSIFERDYLPKLVEQGKVFTRTKEGEERSAEYYAHPRFPNRVRYIPSSPVYFPPHPGLPSPAALWEDD